MICQSHILRHNSLEQHAELRLFNELQIAHNDNVGSFNATCIWHQVVE